MFFSRSSEKTAHEPPPAFEASPLTEKVVSGEVVFTPTAPLSAITRLYKAGLLVLPIELTLRKKYNPPADCPIPKCEFAVLGAQLIAEPLSSLTEPVQPLLVQPG